MGDIVATRNTRDLEARLDKKEAALQEVALSAICHLSEQGQVEILGSLANALKDCTRINLSAEVLDALRQIVKNGEENAERRSKFSASGGFCD